MADNVGWNENSPADTESAGLGDDRMRSIMTSVRQGLDSEHNWPSAGGNSIGIHRLGSARPYVGTQSQVSSAGTEGRLMYASDTSRLFHVGSGGTVLLGGPTMLSVGSFPGTVPQRHYWAEEIGIGITGSSGSTTLTFPNSGYSGAPYVFLSGNWPSVPAGVYVFTVSDIGTGSCIVSAADPPSSSYRSSATFFWRSLGTRVL